MYRRGEARIIFLDIDGVLNNSQWIALMCHEKEEAKNISPDLVAKLNQVIEATGALVVVSSAWRIINSRLELQEKLVKRGFIGTVLDKTTTKPLAGSYRRDHQIFEWLRVNEEQKRYDVKSWCAIDDDSQDMTNIPKERFVHTHFSQGITDEHVERMIKILRT